MNCAETKVKLFEKSLTVYIFRVNLLLGTARRLILHVIHITCDNDAGRPLPTWPTGWLFNWTMMGGGKKKVVDDNKWKKTVYNILPHRPHEVDNLAN